MQRLRHNAVVAVAAIEIIEGFPVDPAISDERHIDPRRVGEQFGGQASFEKAAEQLVEASCSCAETTAVFLGVDLALSLAAHTQQDGPLPSSRPELAVRISSNECLIPMLAAIPILVAPL